jgi:hypothetical protein
MFVRFVCLLLLFLNLSVFLIRSEIPWRVLDSSIYNPFDRALNQTSLKLFFKRFKVEELFRYIFIYLSIFTFLLLAYSTFVLRWILADCEGLK